MLDPRVSLAAERTLLSWLRTGLGVIGLGAAGSHLMHDGPAVPPGVIMMIVIGISLPLVAALRYRRSMRRLNAGLELSPDEPVINTLLVVVVALVAGGVAMWLLLNA
jgi:putative membrane protein